MNSGLKMKLCQLIEYEVWNIFMEKVCKKCAPKANPRSLFSFGKKPKIANVCQKLLKKIIKNIFIF